MIWLRTLLFTIIAPGTITILIPYWLLSSGIGSSVLKLGGLRFLGLLPLLLGVGIYLWCVADFAVKGRGTPAPYDPPKALVVTGLYRYVRNPMYIGVLLVLLGEAICFAAAILFPYTAVVFAGFHLRVVYYEEPALRRLFGESYIQYCAAVPRWVPRWHSSSVTQS